MPDSTRILAELTAASLERELMGYRVLRQIGSGSMGIVFEAEQLSIGRRVAVKVLPPNLALRERTVRRFLREASAMGKLGHANIVDVFEVGSLENLHFFSMKYVEGPPLDRVLRAGPLAIADVVQIGIDVAGALAHAHSRGVLHRDVKPANLLRDGERVVLTDFGLARPIDSEDGGSMTESGDLVGTPLYMSPEQISGEQERVDGRADVWGLGATLYELLAQRPPFNGPSAQSILHAILQRDPPLLRRLRQDVPRDLEAVVLKCLEKDPARRYSGAAALRDDLVAVREGEQVSARTPRFFDPAVRWTRRHPLEATLVGLSLCAAIVLGLFWQQAAAMVKTSRQELSSAVDEKDEAVKRREQELARRRQAGAIHLLSEVNTQWTQGDEPAKREAEDRLLDLVDYLMLNARSFEELGIAADGIRLFASWMHERPGGDQRVLELVGDLLVQGPVPAAGPGVELPPGWDLMMRAALLTGLERLTEALECHRQRALLDPTDPRPLLDAARIEQRRSQEASARRHTAESRYHLANALELLRAASNLAVRAEDTDLLAAALTERARCLLDAGRPDLAQLELRRVLEQDRSLVSAYSLLRRAERAVQASSGEAEPTAEAPAGFALPTAAIEGVLPPGELEQLQSAGRGLKSIYEGLHGLLRSAATPEGGGAPGPGAADARE